MRSRSVFAVSTVSIAAFKSAGFLCAIRTAISSAGTFLLTDIDDRKRAEAQLAGEKRLLEMVASSCPLTDVLTALCNL